MFCKDCHWRHEEKDRKGPNGEAQGRCIASCPCITVIALPQHNTITGQITPTITEFTNWPLTSEDCQECGDFKNKIRLSE